MQFNRKILYLEDHEDTRELVTLVLRNEGYCLISDNNFSNALALAQTTSFDLIMLDNSLADGSGLEFCKRVREFDAVTPILFYSGGAYESDKLDAVRAERKATWSNPARFLNYCGQFHV
jgi:DNA-binding response OmpR family regulator